MIIPADSDGLRRAGQALDAGRPIVAPTRMPLPYLAAATDAAVINFAKGRPADQPSGVAVADFSVLAPYLGLDADTLRFSQRLAERELLNLLLPVTEGAPAWMRSAATAGFLGITMAWAAFARSLLDRHGHLYVSSANRSGGPVSSTAADANQAFDDELLVIDGDQTRDPSTASGSGTMIKVRPRRQLELVRHGIHDRGVDHDQFLRQLMRRWRR